MQRNRRTERKAPEIPIVFDRGKARYFHGRTQILKTFTKFIAMSDQEKAGTIFLIQGAPGAGKTALLAECARRVKEKGWKVGRVGVLDLCDPALLRRSLGLRRLGLDRAEVEAGIPGFVRGRLGFSRLQKTIKPLLQKIRKPVLLLLDEAQSLGTVAEGSEERRLALMRTLNAIHNGEMGKPVFLLLAGLGRTREFLGTLDISRLGGKAFVELGALDRDAVHAVLRDWLTREGGVRESPEPWIDAIAEETHGWPQHILAYIDPALEQIRLDEGAMLPEGLKVVLEKGREARAAYYEHRADGLDIEMRESLARPFRDLPPGGSLRKEQIMASLTHDFSPDQAGRIFRRAEGKGIISSRAGVYNIPIPSMHKWLVSNYAKGVAKDAPTESPDRGQERSPQRTDQDAERGEKERGQPAPGSKGKDHLPPPTKSSPPAKPKDRDSGMDFGL